MASADRHTDCSVVFGSSPRGGGELRAISGRESGDGRGWRMLAPGKVLCRRTMAESRVPARRPHLRGSLGHGQVPRRRAPLCRSGRLPETMPFRVGGRVSRPCLHGRCGRDPSVRFLGRSRVVRGVSFDGAVLARRRTSSPVGRRRGPLGAAEWEGEGRYKGITLPSPFAACDGSSCIRSAMPPAWPKLRGALFT